MLVSGLPIAACASRSFAAVMDLHLEGMDHDQVATDLGVPITTVYSRFHKAKALLRRILEGDGRGAG